MAQLKNEIERNYYKEKVDKAKETEDIEKQKFISELMNFWGNEIKVISFSKEEKNKFKRQLFSTLLCYIIIEISF